jgi:hypothetical protein
MASACAPRVNVSLPGGTGTAAPAALDYFQKARATCSSVQSWSAEMSLAGRVRGATVRGRVLAGSRASGDLRLEGVAPFGAPLFILAARDERASVLLPREGRVLRDVDAREVLDALTALRLSAADLHAVLTGCLVASPVPSNPRALDNGWLAVDVGEGVEAFLREDEAGWRIRRARIGDLALAYDQYEGGGPREISIVARDGSQPTSSPAAQLRVRLAQVESDAALPDDAFTLEVPAAARPMGLEELRTRGLRSGPS